MSKDIVERLRQYSDNSTFGIRPHLLEAADIIVVLRQGIEALRSDREEADDAVVMANEAVRGQAQQIVKLYEEIDRLKEALKPLAALIVPDGIRWNAGHYSIRFADIERAKELVDSTVEVE